MAILEFILAVAVILVVVSGVPIGVWHLVHTLRRKHRLELQSDERENARQVAEDFSRITKELTEGSNINYVDYLTANKREGKVKVITR